MGPAELQVSGINHVVLHVREMPRSRAFYIDLLGFEDRAEDGGGAATRCFLRCGAQGLDLFEVEDDFEVGREMNHMALNVAAEGIEEVCAALERVGVEHSEPTHRHTVFVHDPDGHRLEILPVAANERCRERAAARQSA